MRTTQFLVTEPEAIDAQRGLLKVAKGQRYPSLSLTSAYGKVAFPLSRNESYVLHEYACHEGNYAMGNILRGARLKEADEAKKTKQQ